MTEQEKYIKQIQQKWIERKKDEEMWRQFQGLARLVSDELYSSESHFIYELIQNAQDNSYSPDVIPEISFHLLTDGILIQNNEIGFNEDNITSICNFTNSSKKNKELGYIGEKGIGFKSVFAISDTPAIHSNGYRFHFKKGEYIEPYWISDFKSYPSRFSDLTYTSIYLPYSDDFEHKSDIEKKIKDIEPFLLLFIDKLKKIQIYNKDILVLDVSKELINHDRLNELILKTTKAKYDFITINKIISRPENLIEQKREKIKDREIIFAFPLDEIKDDRIFAFLPTQVKSGLPFYIQADFLLTASREEILIDREWNKWLIDEIQRFYEAIITIFQNHKSLKYSYLKYYKKNNGNNPIFNSLYEKTIKSIKNKEIILNNIEIWEKPENILILDGIDLEIDLLKKLFGANFSVIHPDFKIDKQLIDKFNIKKINKDTLIDRICRYLENTKDIEVIELKAFTSFLADHETENLIRRVRKILPILPKINVNTEKYFDAQSIFLSDKYNPQFSIESMIKGFKIDFSTWNFLSDYYLSNEKLKRFVLKIVGDSNQKIISFFEAHTDILHEYLYADIENHYPKVLDFLIETKVEDQIIKKLPLILTNQNEFKSAHKLTEIYFSHSGTESLEILHHKLLNILSNTQRYKELYIRVYGIKTADNVTIIMDQYLPWFEQNKNSRNRENDLRILELTKKILYHFDDFDENQKKLLKNKILFISTNSSNHYIKSEKIYLSQTLQQVIYGTDSIEKFILTAKKELFDFLDARYEHIFEEIDESKIIRFMDLIPFSKSLRKDDTESFIKSLKPDLVKEENLKAIKLVVENNPNSDSLKTLKVYDHRDRLDEVQNLYFLKIGDTNIAHLNDDYKKMNLEWGYLKQYFRESGKKVKDIQYIISYLQSESIDRSEAEKVFRYIDTEDLSNPQSLQKLFKTHKLIFDAENNRKYLDDVRWKRDKSAKTILSEIYTQDLERFFVKKLGLSDDVTIKSVIDELKTFDKKSFEYYELLIKLGELAGEEIQIQKFYNDNGLNKHISDDNPKTIRSFILGRLQLFLLDNGKSNQDDNFYFNDLNLENYDSVLLNKIFSALEDAPPLKHFEPLVSHLCIKKLSDLSVKNHCGKFIREFELSKFQQYLQFAYDYLYSEKKIKYDEVIANIDHFQSINMIKTISIYDRLYTSRSMGQHAITDASIDFFIEIDTLNATSEEGIYKFIGQKFGIEYEKIELYAQKGERYRKDKNIKSDPHFSVEFAELSSTKDKNELQIDFINDNTNEQGLPKTLPESFDNHKGTGDTAPFTASKNQGTLIIDEEKYASSSQKERDGNTNTFRTSSSQRTTQNPNEIKKVRSFLYDQYEGHCQICGDTFAYKGENYFEIGSLNVGKNRDVNVKGNSLCLCLKHQKIFEFALHKYTFYEDHLKYLHEIRSEDLDSAFGQRYDFVGKDDINEENDAFYNLHDDDDFMRDDIRFLPIKIFGKTEYIKMTEAHESNMIIELNRK